MNDTDMPTVRLLRSMFGSVRTTSYFIGEDTRTRTRSTVHFAEVRFDSDLQPQPIDAPDPAYTLCVAGMQEDGSVTHWHTIGYTDSTTPLRAIGGVKSPEETIEAVTYLLEQARGYHRD